MPPPPIPAESPQQEPNHKLLSRHRFLTPRPRPATTRKQFSKHFRRRRAAAEPRVRSGAASPGAGTACAACSARPHPGPQLRRFPPRSAAPRLGCDRGCVPVLPGEPRPCVAVPREREGSALLLGHTAVDGNPPAPPELFRRFPGCCGSQCTCAAVGLSCTERCQRCSLLKVNQKLSLS